MRQRKISINLLRKLFFAALPYLLVAILLMLYNYIRFDNPFEFGQAYQLTVANQSNYGITFNMSTMVNLMQNNWNNFFGYSKIVSYFPYLNHSGVFLIFLFYSGYSIFLDQTFVKILVKSI